MQKHDEISEASSEEEDGSDEEMIIGKKIDSEKKVSKNAMKKITKEGPLKGKNKTYYDKEGQPITAFEYHFGNQKEVRKNSKDFLEEQKKRLKETDFEDKAQEKKRKRELKMKKKKQLRREMGYSSGEEEQEVRLASYESE